MDLGLQGGFDYLGLRYPRLPTTIDFAVDLDPGACQIFSSNFPDVEPVCGDVRETRHLVQAHDILTGGFPCQSFSIVAQNPPRLGYSDERGRLFFEMCSLLSQHKPRVFIAENVKGLLSANRGNAFPLVIRSFADCGYHVSHALLNAADWGVPQNRERVFIVGFREDEDFARFQFPQPTTPEGARVPLEAVIDHDVDQKYYFSERAVQGMLRVRHKMNKGRAQDPSKPCNTVGAHLAKVSLNSTDPVLFEGGKYRRFTPKEVARIQSFPDDFVLDGPDARLYRALGNAVAPVVMWHVSVSALSACGVVPVDLRPRSIKRSA